MSEPNDNGRMVAVSAARLLAVRDALVAKDIDEAYHQLLMAIDGDLRVALAFNGDHWAMLEHLVSLAPQATKYEPNG